MLDVMGKSHEELRAMQETLHDIYKVLKGAADYLQFVLLTGVSKFAGLSIFSALNNLKDISLNGKYATICGYTQQELESNFPEYLAETAEEMSKTPEELLAIVRQWYNGYSWDGRTSVYNPFGILLFLDEKKFKSYWFRTGTPTFPDKAAQATQRYRAVPAADSGEGIHFQQLRPRTSRNAPAALPDRLPDHTGNHNGRYP